MYSVWRLHLRLPSACSKISAQVGGRLDCISNAWPVLSATSEEQFTKLALNEILISIEYMTIS